MDKPSSPTTSSQQAIKELPNEFLIPEIKKLIDQGHTVTFRAKGISMHPFLVGGRDEVVLKAVERPLKKYDVILAEVAPKSYMIHRIIDINDQRIVMKGDGNRVQRETFPHDKVLGIVVAFRRKGGRSYVRVEDFRWKAYSRLWVALSPLHIVLLPFFRRIWLRFFS